MTNTKSEIPATSGVLFGLQNSFIRLFTFVLSPANAYGHVVTTMAFISQWVGLNLGAFSTSSEKNFNVEKNNNLFVMVLKNEIIIQEVE